MKTLRSRRIRFVLLGATASLLSACHTWKHYEIAPANGVHQRGPDKVRLTMLDSTQIEIAGPQIIAAQIVGERVLEGSMIPYDTVRVPGDSVATVEIRTTSTVRTVALIAGIVCATYVGALAYESDFYGGNSRPYLSGRHR
jgi:hypothetical protein